MWIINITKNTESGTKGDMRWWNQTDASGFGFKVKSCKPFYASAIHFDTEELCPACSGFFRRWLR